MAPACLTYSREGGGDGVGDIQGEGERHIVVVQGARVRGNRRADRRRVLACDL